MDCNEGSLFTSHNLVGGSYVSGGSHHRISVRLDGGETVAWSASRPERTNWLVFNSGNAVAALSAHSKVEFSFEIYNGRTHLIFLLHGLSKAIQESCR